jgi:hypothetical protein
VQIPCVLRTQAPVLELQHAACGQVVDAHEEPTPENVPEQAELDVVEHAPAPLQHAPGHGLGVHDTPIPMNVVRQLAMFVVVHVPLPLQHAPLHGLGTQEAAVLTRTVPAGQEPD